MIIEPGGSGVYADACPTKPLLGSERKPMIAVNRPNER
jgi:hypothetical protein